MAHRKAPTEAGAETGANSLPTGEPHRTSRPALGLFFCFAARGWSGIYSVAATHQAEPGRTSRPVPGLFFCLAARDWSGIYFVATAHQAEPGSPLPLRSVLIRSPPGSRTALRVLCLAFSFASPLAIGAVSILLPPPIPRRQNRCCPIFFRFHAGLRAF